VVALSEAAEAMWDEETDFEGVSEALVTADNPPDSVFERLRSVAANTPECEVQGDEFFSSANSSSEANAHARLI
jgi:hypothetical protein